jgi:hypothetical protein
LVEYFSHIGLAQALGRQSLGGMGQYLMLCRIVVSLNKSRAMPTRRSSYLLTP